MIYYFPNSNNMGMFENYNINSSFNPKTYKIISKNNDIIFQGPHKSNMINSQYMVFSVIRKLNTYTYNNEDCYVYIETNSKFYKNFTDTNAYVWSIH